MNNFDTKFREILKVSHFLIPQNWTDEETGEVTPNVDYEALRTKFEILHYPLLQNLTESHEIRYQDGREKVNEVYVEKSLIIAPIDLVLKGETNSDDMTDTSPPSYTMYIGVVPKFQQATVEAFELVDWWRYLLIIMTLVVSLGLTAICVFQTSHSVIKPLR